MITFRTSLGVLIVMSPIGWFLACIFGVLACLLATDARSHDIPWQILGALVMGSLLASVPVAITLFSAYRALEEASPTAVNFDPIRSINWRWIGFVLLCGLEALVLPLTVVAAAADDDTLIISIPFNLVISTAAVLLACWPYQKRAAIAICVAHLLGIVLATFAAAIEIESVVVSGLLLFVTGIALSLVGRRPQTTRVVFALSTVIFIVIAFLVIAIGNVSQTQAEAPLFAAIVAYQILFVPLALLMLYREFSGREQPFRAQFGLKQVFGVMVIVCIASALTKAAHSVNDEVRVAVSLVIGMLVFIGVVTAIAAGWWARWSDNHPRMSNANAT